MYIWFQQHFSWGKARNNYDSRELRRISRPRLTRCVLKRNAVAAELHIYVEHVYLYFLSPLFFFGENPSFGVSAKKLDAANELKHPSKCFYTSRYIYIVHTRMVRIYIKYHLTFGRVGESFCVLCLVRNTLRLYICIYIYMMLKVDVIHRRGGFASTGVELRLPSFWFIYICCRRKYNIHILVYVDCMASAIVCIAHKLLLTGIINGTQCRVWLVMHVAIDAARPDHSARAQVKWFSTAKHTRNAEAAFESAPLELARLGDHWNKTKNIFKYSILDARNGLRFSICAA